MLCYALSGIRYFIVERFLPASMRYIVKQSEFLLGKKKKSGYRFLISYAFFESLFAFRTAVFLMGKFLRRVRLKLCGKREP